ncbi:unnamed protein product [Effrenium voratum]|uniref:PKS/mFAS DH domain-containing protein n=1 Tax=Effrenium voratum TaxID=2562239 RepID=A0AA36IUQ4_9DINO|nr:unnamed protein product [Effrenium voratum]CAJ1393884.1 unnamed protein product [Effrenium voratum]CAJ1418766.1 unnamed protein product [Effrenium voratum]|mmetsp:Transcript_27325/g.64967  ORF Transcript_27325/g.64967 Transcript_27325/m.64967 type:complete len:372 (-) Transcript_27325:59-1174(-)
MADAALASAEAIMADAQAMYPETPSVSESLSGFEAPKTQMVSYQQRQLYRSKASEALTLAKEALVSFRRAGDKKKVAALKVVVDANMAMDKTFDAMMAASDELAMIKRTSDKQAEAEVSEMLAEVQISRGDSGSASQTLSDALVLYRDLSQKAGEAKMLQLLAGLKLRGSRTKEALSLAQQAVGLYQAMGDAKGEEACKRIINRAYAESGDTDKAPDRPEALKALEDLASAVENQDKSLWKNAIVNLNKSSAYTQHDVQQIFGAALKKDRRAAAGFLQQMGVRSTGSAPELVIREVTRVFTYVGFRVGGLGYGPRFRCLQPTHGLMVQGDPNTMHAVGCMKIAEEADDWEKELQYHPGILDGCLQSQSALG